MIHVDPRASLESATNPMHMTLDTNSEAAGVNTRSPVKRQVIRKTHRAVKNQMAAKQRMAVVNSPRMQAQEVYYNHMKQ